MARHWLVTRMLPGAARSGRHDTHEGLSLGISGYLADQPEKGKNYADYGIFSWFSVSGLNALQVSEDRCSIQLSYGRTMPVRRYRTSWPSSHSTPASARPGSGKGLGPVISREERLRVT